MKRAIRGGREKPHKPILWLTVLNLMDSSYITKNEIYFDDELVKEFKRVFSNYALEDDLPQPSQPFFHLRSSGIWHHRIKAGEEEYYASLTTSGGGSKRIKRAIQYAYLDEDLYDELQNPVMRGNLRRSILALLHDEKRGQA